MNVCRNFYPGSTGGAGISSLLGRYRPQDCKHNKETFDNKSFVSYNQLLFPATLLYQILTYSSNEIQVNLPVSGEIVCSYVGAVNVLMVFPNDLHLGLYHITLR